jgi:polyferredoxin
MDKVGLQKGLIRYSSENEILKKEQFKLTTRMKGYIGVLIILIGVLLSMLFLRNDVEATVLRMPGQMFEHKGDNISNVYTFKVVNKTSRDFNDVHFKLVAPKGVIKLVGEKAIQVKKDDLAEGTMFVEINSSLIEGDKIKLKIEVYNGNELIDTETTNFLGPISFN